jgi:hypothetical protein
VQSQGTVDRFGPAREALTRCDDDEFSCDERALDIVLTLGHEQRVQGLDAVVVTMPDGGTTVVGPDIDRMSMDE